MVQHYSVFLGGEIGVCGRESLPCCTVAVAVMFDDSVNTVLPLAE